MTLQSYLQLINREWEVIIFKIIQATVLFTSKFFCYYNGA